MPTTTPLSQDQRARLASLLQSRLDERVRQREAQLQQQSQVESARQTLLQDADDAAERAGEHEVEGIVADLDSSEFQAISAALLRVHRSDYGLCIDCQLAIPYERLLLEPQALRCAGCQARHERRLKLTRTPG